MKFLFHLGGNWMGRGPSQIRAACVVIDKGERRSWCTPSSPFTVITAKRVVASRPASRDDWEFQ